MDAETWGAICLVIDRSIQPPAYMIQILDLSKYSTLFSQELYVGCVYNCSDALFHSFEIDSGFVGFSFVDNNEAKDFSQKVLQAIPKHDPSVPTAPMQKNTIKTWVSKASMATGIKLPGVQQGMNIGVPTGFVHKQHIGYDPAKGFECSDIPEQWKAMFRSAGIKKADLQSPEKAAVIYETLQNELGADFLEKDPPVAPSVPAKGGKKGPASPEEGCCGT
jgi:Wiskott-Aldrich syndrome protein